MSAPLRPDVAAFLKAVDALPGPRLWQMSATDARAVGTASRGITELPTGPIARLETLAMPGPAGPIRLRVHDDRPGRGPGPVLVFFHGGGFVIGDLDIYQPLCAEIARSLDLPVVAVDYRLAPEHPFPAAPEDCEAAARWIAANGAALGLDPAGLVLAGDSAGGTMTIVTAMALRDAPAAVPVVSQWTLYPATDLVTRYPSYADYPAGFLLGQDALRWFGDAYRADPDDVRASPMQGTMAGLPPALVVTASHDPIRDQGRAYAAALASAGVAVSFHEAVGTIHGFAYLRRAIPSAQDDLARALDAMRALLAGASR